MRVEKHPEVLLPERDRSGDRFTDFAYLPPTALILSALKRDLQLAGITGLSEVGPILAAAARADTAVTVTRGSYNYAATMLGEPHAPDGPTS